MIQTRTRLLIIGACRIVVKNNKGKVFNVTFFQLDLVFALAREEKILFLSKKWILRFYPKKIGKYFVHVTFALLRYVMAYHDKFHGISHFVETNDIKIFFDNKYKTFIDYKTHPGYIINC